MLISNRVCPHWVINAETRSTAKNCCANSMETIHDFQMRSNTAGVYSRSMHHLKAQDEARNPLKSLGTVQHWSGRVYHRNHRLGAADRPTLGPSPHLLSQYFFIIILPYKRVASSNEKPQIDGNILRRKCPLLFGARILIYWPSIQGLKIDKVEKE